MAGHAIIKIYSWLDAINRVKLGWVFFGLVSIKTQQLLKCVQSVDFIKSVKKNVSFIKQTFYFY